MSSKLPAEFLERLARIVPPGLQHQVKRGMSEQKPTTFRINLLKSSPNIVLREMEEGGVQCEPAFLIPQAYLVKKGSFKKIQKFKCYQEGGIYLQSLSSQIPVLVLKPQPGERILDMAAAPGGKTCQIAALMGNVGKIVALEPNSIRFEKLKFNLERQGVKIAQALKISGERVGARHAVPLQENLFDRILLDAPCSSEGTFCTTDPRSFNHWSVEWVQKIAVLQKKLMMKAISCLKPGGDLVYSTCALSPEENEEVIDFALQEHPGKIRIIDIPLKFPFLKPALGSTTLPSWNNKKFNPEISKARRIYPSETMEGFFVCWMRKN